MKNSTIERIKEVRLNNRLTQKQFAEQLGVSLSSYLLIETGKRSINIKILESIHEKYAISSDWLMFGDKNNSNEIAEVFHTLFIAQQNANKVMVKALDILEKYNNDLKK